jgi:hypothetical protein
MAGTEQADGATASQTAGNDMAVAEALQAMESAERELNSVREKFDEEVRIMQAGMNKSQEAIRVSAEIIKSYNERLVRVENAIHRVDNFEGDYQQLMESKEALEQDNIALNNKIDAMQTKFDKYVSRPAPFQYNKTIVCYNVEKLDGEDDDEGIKWEIATGLLKYGFKLDPMPTIIAVSRLPHNPVDLKFTPGFKIEFATEETRDNVLRAAKNLKDGRMKGISVRRSMSQGERNQVQAYQHMERTFANHGIAIPHMYPSGNLKRPPKPSYAAAAAPWAPAPSQQRAPVAAAAPLQQRAPSTAPTAPHVDFPPVADAALFPLRGARQPVNVLER